MGKKTKIGVLADDLEFILLSAGKKSLPAEIVYFVEKTSDILPIIPESAKIARYSFEKGYSPEESDDFLKAVVSRSNIEQAARENGVSCFWFSLAGENVRFVSSWAVKNGFSLIGRPDLIEKLENKILFDRFLARHKIKKPKSKEIIYERGKSIAFRYPFVLQKPVSSGGEGTFFIKGKNSLEHPAKAGLKNKSKTLLREWLKGPACGITLSVCQKGAITSAVRMQCFEKEDAWGRKAFLGVQFLAHSFFSKKQIKEMNETFFRVGYLFRERGWFGMFNFDFIISEKKGICLIECNPRISAASSLLFHYPGLNNGFDMAEIFLKESLGKKKNASKEPFVFYGISESRFQGSVFYPEAKVGLGRKAEVKRVFQEGVYGQSRGKIVFLSRDLGKISSAGERFILKNEVSANEIRENGFVTSTVLSNYPLFNLGGGLSKAGEIIKKKFNYVD